MKWKGIRIMWWTVRQWSQESKRGLSSCFLTWSTSFCKSAGAWSVEESRHLLFELFWVENSKTKTVNLVESKTDLRSEAILCRTKLMGQSRVWSFRGCYLLMMFMHGFALKSFDWKRLVLNSFSTFVYWWPPLAIASVWAPGSLWQQTIVVSWRQRLVQNISRIVLLGKLIQFGLNVWTFFLVKKHHSIID